jgi:hypothetical protein
MRLTLKQPFVVAGAAALVLAATGYAESGTLGPRSHGRPSVTPPPKCVNGQRPPGCRPGGKDNDPPGSGDKHGPGDRSVTPPGKKK